MTRPLQQRHRGAPGAEGFTLIEMLIALLLLAIVASIALPAYNEHVRRSRRAEAQAALLQAAHYLEREATAKGTYSESDLPQSLTEVPSRAYEVSRAPSADATQAALSFTLHARPRGGQVKDHCGTFTLSNTGERGLLGNTAKVADCWNR